MATSCAHPKERRLPLGSVPHPSGIGRIVTGLCRQCATKLQHLVVNTRSVAEFDHLEAR